MDLWGAEYKKSTTYQIKTQIDSVANLGLLQYLTEREYYL
jgi:hypothetical protein